jgi:hypothetical protein
MPVHGAKWIASSQALLAMTGKQIYSMGYISSQALRSPLCGRLRTMLRIAFRRMRPIMVRDGAMRLLTMRV